MSQTTYNFAACEENKERAKTAGTFTLTIMSLKAKIWLIILITIAAALRYHGLFTNVFQADEALFSTWARQIAVWRDPLLGSQLVDKPPFLFYSQALFYPILGPVEWAARMPNLISSILLVPLTGMLCWQLYRNEIQSVLVAAFISFSPLLIQFSATAYSDPLLTSLLVLSIIIATLVRPDGSSTKPAISNLASRLAVASGAVFGIALGTKYQALLVLPFLLGLGILYQWNRSTWLRWLAGFGAVILVVLLWDAARSNAPSFWTAQLTSIGGLRGIWSWELWPRFEGWLEQWRYIFGSSELLLAALAVAIPLLILAFYKKDRFASVDLLLGVFVLGFLIVHWFVAVPLWERYLILIVPFLGLLLVRVIWRILDYVKSLVHPYSSRDQLDNYILLALSLAFFVMLLPTVRMAYYGDLPIGGDPDADKTLVVLADYLKGQPEGTVLYDHWYSWQWRYHLFDTGVYISWFRNPASLADDLRVFGQGVEARYLALPEASEAQPVVRAVLSAGYDLMPLPFDAESQGEPALILYKVVPQ